MSTKITNCDRLSITTDLWKCKATLDCYLGVTMHFYDQQFDDMNDCAIACEHHTDDETGKGVIRHLDKILHAHLWSLKSSSLQFKVPKQKRSILGSSLATPTSQIIEMFITSIRISRTNKTYKFFIIFCNKLFCHTLYDLQTNDSFPRFWSIGPA